MNSLSREMGGAATPVLRVLGGHRALNAEDIRLLADIAAASRSHPPGTELVAEGGAARPAFLLSGWACRLRLLSDGRRQIFGYVLPGDLIGSLLAPADLASPYAVQAITRLDLADAGALREQVPYRPALQLALHAAARIDAIWAHDQMAGLGRQTAFERMGRLLLELHHRLQVAGLTNGDQFRAPLTQEMLGDTLGLSAVHVNRTLQQMRREGLAYMQDRWVTLTDRRLLAATSDFRVPRSTTGAQPSPLSRPRAL